MKVDPLISLNLQIQSFVGLPLLSIGMLLRVAIEMALSITSNGGPSSSPPSHGLGAYRHGVLGSSVSARACERPLTVAGLDLRSLKDGSV